MKKLLSITLLLYSCFAFSQETIAVSYNKTPLKTVLADISAKTNLLFSYSEEAVASKTLTLAENSISIDQFLVEASRQTGLSFKKVSDQQVIISVPDTRIDVCGYLFDAETKEPLAFATVIVEGQSRGTTSDENGYFSLDKVSQQAILVIQSVGYNNTKLNARSYTNQTCQNILVRPSVQSLDEIVILAYITKGISKSEDGSVIMKNDELGVLPGMVEPDVFQSIQLIPGITSLDESAAGIQIRGGSPDQNLILFDNIKMYNTGHFFGMLSAINPYITESAKVYKGGADPKYGDRISGVIDISSDENVPEKFNGGVGLNGTHGDVFIKAPFSESVGVVLSARRSYTDLLRTPTFDALSEKVFQNTKLVTDTAGVVTEEEEEEFEDNVGEEDFFFYDGSAKLIIAPSDNDKVSISGLFANNDLDFSVRDDEDITSDRLIVEQQGASFVWEGTKAKKWHHTLTGYYSKLDVDYRNRVTQELVVEEENLRRNTVEDYGFSADLMYDISSKHKVKAGYQYSNIETFFRLFRNENDAGTDNPREFDELNMGVNRAHTVFGEYRYIPKEKALISLGLRASHFSVVEDFFIEPRLNIEYPLSDAVRVKATAEKRYQSISQLVEFEDTQLRLENNIWTLSDGDEIPVLESTQFSGGLLFDADGWTLDIDGYIKSIKGLTSFTNGFTNDTDELSEGESDIYGVDVLVKKKLGDYNIWLGYTFNDITYTFNDLQNTSFPGNNDITHNFRISNTYETNNWQFSLGWTYRTGSPFTPADSFDPNTGDIEFGAINSERLPNYHRLDASILYRWGKKADGWKGALGVSAQNLYSRQVPTSVFYRVNEDPDTGSDELDQIEQLSLGFTPNITLRLYF